MNTTDKNPQFHSYAHGKLLLSGEYFVLDGAKALAIPTRFGQRLEVFSENEQDGKLIWEGLSNKNEIFLRVTFDLNDFEVVKKEGEVSHDLLQDLLREARKRQPGFLAQKQNIKAISKIEFSLGWGLGSSSTLVYNLAQWSQVDPFQLLFATLEGSGYDVACAGAKEAIVYQLKNEQPHWNELQFEPPFAERLFFIYLGKKQNSSDAVRKFRNQPRVQKTIEHISGITEQMLVSATAADFCALMEEHETVIAEALCLPKVKDLFFSDFLGAAKSLGAWGGDFVMALAENESFDTAAYFKAKGFETVFGFKDIIFTR